MSYTPEQLSAVESRGKNLLVSAAAGSGKTRVLVGRVLSRIFEERLPLSRFLVITFTRAAAAELRERVFSGLSALAAERPDDMFLRRQLVSRSDFITTIDGLCSLLLREFSHIAGAGDFRIADEAEAKALREATITGALEAVFADTSGDVRAFVAALPPGGDRAAKTAILAAHTQLRSHAYPDAWAESAVALYGGDFDSGVYGTLLRERALALARASIDAVSRALEIAEREPSLAGYRASLESDVTLAVRIADELTHGSLGGAGTLLGGKLPAIGTVRGGDEALKNSVKSLRDVWRAAYGELQKLLCGAERFSDELAAQTPVLRGLFAATRMFEDELHRLKAARSLLDFGDLGHAAIKLLASDDVARAFGERFDEVLVDEFQDTNGVQTLIVERLAAHSRLFMVGDVKQSIYRFRLAKPEIFLERYRSFAKLEDAGEAVNAKVILSRNFRSRREVVDAANYLFRNLMRGGASELEYGDDERLIAERDDAPDARYNTEFYVVDVPPNDGDEDDDDTEPIDETAREAAFAARRVRDMIDEGFAAPDDIAILLRTGKDRAYMYVAALAAQGIPTAGAAAAGITEELTLIMSLLRVIDNPFLDVPLIGVMRSPLYGFTPDELAETRAAARHGDFFGAVTAAAESGGGKAAEFLESLEAYRNDAARLTPDRLLLHIYAKTGIAGLFSALRGGAERAENLHTLYTHARTFAGGVRGGLSGFIGYMDSIFEHGSFADGAAQTGGVRVMTVHKSKGLEFPVVLLCGMGTKFNFRSNSDALLLHPTLGVGMKVFDETRRVTYPSGAWLAVNAALNEESLAEELRVLYVAMTRARDKLIITCAAKKARERIASYVAGAADPGDAFFRAASCPMKWLVPLMARHPSGRLLREISGDARFDADAEGEFVVGFAEQDGASVTLALPQGGAALPPEEAHGVSETLSTNLGWRYLGSEMYRVPSKLTATAIKGLRQAVDPDEPQDEVVPDAEAEQGDAAADTPARVFASSVRPRFVSGKTRLTPAERGVALHLAMQYIDYDKCITTDGVRREIARLAEGRYFTEAQAASADADADRITAFFTSPLAARLSASRNVRREFRFSLLDDAARYYPAEAGGMNEKVLLQGVCDLCFEEDGKLVVVDFKSDYVTEATAEARAAEYIPQVDAYARALGRIFGMEVSERVLYFFAVSRAINV